MDLIDGMENPGGLTGQETNAYVASLLGLITELEQQAERLRDEADRERLARRERDRWLANVHEVLRKYRPSRSFSAWDGSSVGLATEVGAVLIDLRDDRDYVQYERNQILEERDALLRFCVWPTSTPLAARWALVGWDRGGQAIMRCCLGQVEAFDAVREAAGLSPATVDGVGGGPKAGESTEG